MRPPQLGARKGFYVMRTDIEKYGLTPGCNACMKLTAGEKPTMGHSSECRTRILERMKEEQGDDVKMRLEQFERRTGQAAQDEESKAKKGSGK